MKGEESDRIGSGCDVWPLLWKGGGLYDHFCEFLRKAAMCYYCR